MAVEAIIGGRRSRFVKSWEAPGVLLDAWEDLEEPHGSPMRSGVVVTFRQGQTFIWQSNVSNPFIPGEVFVAGYDDHPSLDPVERFQEAYRQERQRAAERLGGPLQFEQVWP